MGHLVVGLETEGLYFKLPSLASLEFLQEYSSVTVEVRDPLCVIIVKPCLWCF